MLKFGVYPPKNKHENGTSTIWRCISFWKLWCSNIMLVFTGVYEVIWYPNWKPPFATQILCFTIVKSNARTPLVFRCSWLMLTWHPFFRPGTPGLPNLKDTVGGRNPTNQLIGSLSHCFPGFIHPRWCTISSISRICGKEVRSSFVLVWYVCYVCFVGLIGGCGSGCGCCRYVVLFFGIKWYIFCLLLYSCVFLFCSDVFCLVTLSCCYDQPLLSSKVLGQLPFVNLNGQRNISRWTSVIGEFKALHIAILVAEFSSFSLLERPSWSWSASAATRPRWSACLRSGLSPPRVLFQTASFLCRPIKRRQPPAATPRTEL